MVHHEEAALQKIVVEAFCLLVGEGPALYVNGIDPGVVEEMIAIDVRDVQRRRRVDTGQTAQRDQAIVVGLRKVLRPAAAVAAKPTAAIESVVLQAAPVEFRRHALPVGIVVLLAAEASELHRKQSDG